MQIAELLPYDPIYSKLRSCNPFEAEYMDYVNLLKNGLTAEQAVVKLKLSNPPLLGLRVIETCKKMEAGTIELIQRLFCGGITTNMLCQL